MLTGARRDERWCFCSAGTTPYIPTSPVCGAKRDGIAKPTRSSYSRVMAFRRLSTMKVVSALVRTHCMSVI